MKGAPSGYNHGEIRMMPYRHAKRKFWELQGDPPVLKVPGATEKDGVFDDQVFIEPDEEQGAFEEPAPQPERSEVDVLKEEVEQLKEESERLMVALTAKATPEEPAPMPKVETGVTMLEPPSPPEGAGLLDPESDAIIEPYMKITIDHESGKVLESTTVAPIDDEPDGEGIERKQLMKKLDDAGIVYSKRARTTTLQKKVDDLESEE